MQQKILNLFLCLCFPFVMVAQQSQIPILRFEGVQPFLEKENDTTYLINFWATWCKPCVEELPFIEQIHSDDFDDPVEVILISLDFRNQLESKLIPFIEEHQIKSKVVVLDDPDANAWIDKVDPSWSGALPASIIYKGNKREFYPEGFTDYKSLRKIISNF